MCLPYSLTSYLSSMCAYSTKGLPAPWYEASFGSRIMTFPRISYHLLLSSSWWPQWRLLVKRWAALLCPAIRFSCSRVQASVRFGFGPGSDWCRSVQAWHIVWRRHRLPSIFRSRCCCFANVLSRAFHRAQRAATLLPFLPLILVVLPASLTLNSLLAWASCYSLANSILIFSVLEWQL